MAEFLLPASLANDLATINTRLNDLESSARVNSAAITRNLDTVTATAIAAIAAANLTTADITAKLTAAAVAAVGVGRIRVATVNLPGAELVRSAWSSGPSAATWAANDASSGTGYPRVTITSPGTSCLVIVSGCWYYLGNASAGGFQSSTALSGVSVNGASPSPPLLANSYNAVSTGGAYTLNMPVVLAALYATTAGVSTVFQLQANVDAALGAQPVLPTLFQASLVVIPLN